MKRENEKIIGFLDYREDNLTALKVAVDHALESGATTYRQSARVERNGKYKSLSRFEGLEFYRMKTDKEVLYSKKSRLEKELLEVNEKLNESPRN